MVTTSTIITNSSDGDKTHKENSEVGTSTNAKHLLCCSRYYAVANKYEQEPHSTKANMPEDAKHHNLSCYIMLSIEADDASIVPSGCFSGPIRAPPGCKSWHDVAIFIGYHRRSCHGSIRSPVSIPLWLKEGTVHWTLYPASIRSPVSSPLWLKALYTGHWTLDSTSKSAPT